MKSNRSAVLSKAIVGKFLQKKFALITAAAFLVQIFFPTVSWALTSGPTQPEFTSFEPVSTTQMVNEFSGDFTYNLPIIEVPGPGGSGYPLSLSYHSGVSPEQEASWVGYGWTLNPGAINRGQKGFPDDWDKTNINFYNKTPRNQTLALKTSISAEVFGFDSDFLNGGGLTTSQGIKYNTYKGFGSIIGFGISDPTGVASLNYSRQDGASSFSFDVNPAALLSSNTRKKRKEAAIATKKHIESKNELLNGPAKNIEANADKVFQTHNERVSAKAAVNGAVRLQNFASNFGYTFQENSFNLSPSPNFSGITTTIQYSFEANPLPLPIGQLIGLQGSYTYQDSEELENLTVNGYLYSGHSYLSNEKEILMDYHTEKSNPYNRQSKFIGVPFSNADNFMLMGEGVGGSFRAHQRKAGTFRPNEVKSSTANAFIGVGPRAGSSDAGIGVSVSGGGHFFKTSEWVSKIKFEDPDDYTVDEPFYFRFANDRGGYIDYGDNCFELNMVPVEEKVSFEYEGTQVLDAVIDTDYDPTPIISGEPNEGKRIGRSAHIAYNFHKDMYENTNPNYAAFEKSTSRTAHIDANNTSINSQLGEFSVVNANGLRYNYGLPVYARNEYQITSSLRDAFTKDLNGYLIKMDASNGSTHIAPTDSKNEYFTGEHRPTPYATSYLLTSIVGNDYIDRTANGPSDDDFGSWTKFEYDRAYGSNDKTTGNWYEWRAPYNGFNYQEGSLSTEIDDVASMASGEKEIYFLEKIETESHYALFITSDREDGLSADLDLGDNANAQGTDKLKKLDRIELYAKNDNGNQLIKTVHFEYSNALCSGLPNSLANTGKLTLEKVWFEYENISNAYISPYEFEYAYPGDGIYPAPYDALDNYGFGMTENPTYDPRMSDAWGNYREVATNEYRHLTGISRPDQAPANTYDPAAWHLKVIKLPSGGEIHVQYEQDDYCYVQDKDAHALVSIGSVDKQSSNDPNDWRYYLSTNESGIDCSGFTNPQDCPDLQELETTIRRLYVNQDEKMYFRFLYNLIGTTTPAIDERTAEYIEGYVNVLAVEIDATNGLYIRIGGNSPSDKGINSPQDICKNFVKTQRGGGFYGVTDLSTEVSNPDAFAQMGLFLKAIPAFLAHAAGSSFTLCDNINPIHSFLRIPMVTNKLGGGVRVKRLLMYDSGLENGAATLYGKEYLYETFDESRNRLRSSGVATYEPSSMRQENPFVKPLPEKHQSTFNRIIAGNDIHRLEGPLGESIMPTASVGYSEVIVQDIHQGKTATGYTRNSFHTAKEHPVVVEYSTLDAVRMGPQIDFAGLYLNIKKRVYLNQGFCFKLNGMHGQPAFQGQYGGHYGSADAYLVTSKAFNYFDKDEKLPVYNGFQQPYEYLPLGMDSELLFATKKIEDQDLSLQTNFDMTVAFPPSIYFTLVPFVNGKELEKKVSAQTKVVYYPSVVKSVTTTNFDFSQTSVNKSFDRYTGNPVEVEVTDDYHGLSIQGSNHDGRMTTYTAMASDHYPRMGPMAADEKWRSTLEGDLIVNDAGQEVNLYANTDLSTINEGALVRIQDATQSIDEIYQVLHAQYGHLRLVPPDGSLTNLAEGSYTFAPEDAVIDVVRSANQNLLTADIGSFTVYGAPSLQLNSSAITTAALDDLSNKLNAAAANIGQTQTPDYVDIPEADLQSIQLKDADGNCVSWPSGHFIRLSKNAIAIHKTVSEQIEIPQVYTTSQTHPILADLNQYLQTYYNYALGSFSAMSSYEVSSCSDFSNCDPVTYPNESQYLGKIIQNNAPTINSMRVAQINLLNTLHDDINGQTKTIGDVFSDLSTQSNDAFFIVDQNGDVVNKEVLLTENSSGKTFGLHFPNTSSCSNFEVGGDSKSALSCGFPSAIGTFIQTTDGYLAYDYNGTVTQTEVRFYTNQTITNTYDVPVYQRSFNLDITDLPGYGHAGVNDPFASDHNKRIITVVGDTEGVLTNELCLGEQSLIPNVIAATATTYSDDIALIDIPTSIRNPYYEGTKGKWRPRANYAYNTTNQAGTKNYNSGLFTLTPFNWENISQGSGWIATTEMEYYDQNGMPVQERNALGIPSAVHYDQNRLPALIAANASYTDVFHQDYETTIATQTGVTHDLNVYHSGEKSVKLSSGISNGLQEPFKLGSFILSQDLWDDGARLRLWARTDNPDPALLNDQVNILFKTEGSSAIIGEAKSMKVAAVSKHWVLLEVDVDFKNQNGSVPFDQSMLASEFEVYLDYYFNDADMIWLDDVRFQPLQSTMSTFVYDQDNNRLLASLDDQNFALYYQYDAEGQLIRKLKETERGTKTLQEGYRQLKVVSRN